VAAGAALFLAAGPAFSAPGPHTRAATIDLACQGSGSVRFDTPLTDSPHEVKTSGHLAWTGCKNGSGRPAATGNGSVRLTGKEIESCNSADIRSGSVQFEVSWENGEKSRIIATPSLDDRQDGELLIRQKGTVESGAFAGDNFLATVEAGTTSPERCESSGLTGESGKATVVFWH
jgi:hypothetical protein